LGNVHTEPTSPFENIVKVLYDNTEQFMYLPLEKIRRKGEEGRWKIRRNGSKQSTQKKRRKEKKH
jgi:hypothetical protein